MVGYDHGKFSEFSSGELVNARTALVVGGFQQTESL